MSVAARDQAPATPADLNVVMRVITRRAWGVLAVAGGIIIIGVIWSIFGTVTTTVTASGALGGPGSVVPAGSAIVFVSQADGRQVQAGMAVTLSPLAVGTTSSVELHGTVKVIANQVFSADQIARIIGNDAFGRALAGSNLDTPVLVQLTPSAALRRLIGQQPSGAIPCEGHITTEDMHPFSLISP